MTPSSLSEPLPASPQFEAAASAQAMLFSLPDLPANPAAPPTPPADLPEADEHRAYPRHWGINE